MYKYTHIRTQCHSFHCVHMYFLRGRMTPGSKRMHRLPQRHRRRLFGLCCLRMCICSFIRVFCVRLVGHDASNGAREVRQSVVACRMYINIQAHGCLSSSFTPRAVTACALHLHLPDPREVLQRESVTTPQPPTHPPPLCGSFAGG